MKKEPTVDSDASTAADEFHAEDSIDNIGKEQADLADSVKGLNTELSDAIKSATVKDQPKKIPKVKKLAMPSSAPIKRPLNIVNGAEAMGKNKV